MTNPGLQRTQSHAETPQKWKSQTMNLLTTRSPESIDEELYLQEQDYAKLEELEEISERRIQDLTRELKEKAEQLKRLQESKFKSQERELTVTDSEITHQYSNLKSKIRNLVKGLTKGSKNLSLFHIPRFTNELEQVLEGTMTVFELQVFLAEYCNEERADIPYIAVLLRAVIFNIVRRMLFNHEVFNRYGLNNEEWGAFIHLYEKLLSRPDTISRTSDDDNDDPIPKADVRAKQDASLWRALSLTSMDKNVVKYNLLPMQQSYCTSIIDTICSLLDPFFQTNPRCSREEIYLEVKEVVNVAAELSKVFGKQRAMFEVESKAYIGTTFSAQRMSVGGPPGHGPDQLEENDQGVMPSSDQKYEVVAVISPALYKFGNDDGIHYDVCEVKKEPEVLIIPSHVLANVKIIAADKLKSQLNLPQSPSSDLQETEIKDRGMRPSVETSIVDDQGGSSEKTSTLKPIPPVEDNNIGKLNNQVQSHPNQRTENKSLAQSQTESLKGSSNNVQDEEKRQATSEHDNSGKQIHNHDAFKVARLLEDRFNS